MALLSQHLVQLGATVAAHNLDASASVKGGQFAQQYEQPSVERVGSARGAVGEQGIESLLAGRPLVEDDVFAGVQLSKSREQWGIDRAVERGRLFLGKTSAVWNARFRRRRLGSERRR